MAGCSTPTLPADSSAKRAVDPAVATLGLGILLVLRLIGGGENIVLLAILFAGALFELGWYRIYGSHAIPSTPGRDDTAQ